jgi:hypothetical protein
MDLININNHANPINQKNQGLDIREITILKNSGKSNTMYFLSSLHGKQ